MIFKIFFLAFYLLVSLSARAQWYFGDNTAVNLTNSITYDAGTILVTGALDPSTTAVNAPPASMYFSTSGTVYIKQDSGLTTNWLPIGVSTPSSLTSINGQSGPAVSVVTGTTGTDFNIASAANTITLNIPTATSTNTGKLSSTDWTTFNNKEPAITAATSSDYYRGDKTFQNLGTAVGSVSATFTNKTFDADGAGNSLTNIDDGNIKALAGINASKIADGSVSSTEYQFLNGVTSGIQTQLDGKEPTITTLPIAKGGTNSGTALNNNRVMQSSGGAIVEAAAITANRALQSDANGIPTQSTTTATELGYVSGVTSAIQTQIDGKEPSITVLPLAKGGTNKNLTATAGRVVYSDADSFELTGAGTNGQVLRSNGSSAPTFVNPSINTEQLAEGVNLTTEKLEVYNNHLTSTGTNTYLVESKNADILSNSGFEATSANSSWVSGAGVLANESTVRIQGNQSLKVTLSSQALSISQDSTLYASQFADGVQGLVSVRVKTSVSSVYVCARAAGVSLVNSSFSRCVSVSNDNKWGLYKIPVILGATSNGIEVASYNSSGVSVAVTGDVYIDDAFVGAVDLKQDVDQSRIAGESYFAGTASCSWSRTSTTVGAFGTDADCPGPTVATSTLGSWQTTDSDLPRQTINNLPAGTYKATFILEGLMGASVTPAFAINDGTTTCEAVPGSSDADQGSNTIVQCSFTYTSPGNRVYELYAASASSSVNITNSRTSPRISTKFILEYFGSGSIYSASCGANCVDTFSAKIDGSVISKENVEWLGASTPAGTNNYVKTITVNSGVFSQTPNCTCTVIGASTTADQTCSYAEGSSSSTSIIFYTTSSAVATDLDFNISCQKQGADFTASRTIVGSFNEVVTTPGISKPKTCYYAFGGASATLASPTECTSGTCVEVIDTCGAVTPPSFVSTGIYGPVTFANGTFANSSPVLCTCQGYTVSSGTSRICYPYFTTGNSTWSTNSSGGVTLPIITYSTSLVGANSYVQVKCEGQAP